MNLLEVIDRSGRRIRLTQEQWRHIAKEHPGVIDLEEIKATLVSPLKITPSKYDPEQVRYYYRYNKEKRNYLFVAVKYLNGEGFIVTSYYMRRIP